MWGSGSGSGSGSKPRRSTDHLRISTDGGSFDDRKIPFAPQPRPKGVTSSSSSTAAAAAGASGAKKPNPERGLDSSFLETVHTLGQQLKEQANLMDIVKAGGLGALLFAVITHSAASTNKLKRKEQAHDLPEAPMLALHNQNALRIFRSLAEYPRLYPPTKELYYQALKYMEEIVRRRKEMADTKSCVAEDMEIFKNLSQAIVSNIIKFKGYIIGKEHQKNYNNLDILLDMTVRELAKEEFVYVHLTMSSDVDGTLDC